MHTIRVHGRWLTAIACLAMVCPRMGAAAEDLRRLGPPQASVQPTDVRLDAQRRLWGQLVDPQGRPRAAADVSIWHGGRWVGHTRTHADGRFAFDNLPGGVYQLVAADTAAVCRVWTEPSAPPAAGSAVLLVAGQTIRGQQAGYLLAPPYARGTIPTAPYTGQYDGAVMQTLTSPWVVGGLIAAGIAVPLALSDDANGS